MEEWTGRCLRHEDRRCGGWRSGSRCKQLTQSDGGPGPGWVNTPPTLKHTTRLMKTGSFVSDVLGPHGAFCHFEVFAFSCSVTHWQVFLWSCRTGLVASGPRGSLLGPAGKIFPLRGSASESGGIVEVQQTKQKESRKKDHRHEAAAVHLNY